MLKRLSLSSRTLVPLAALMALQLAPTPAVAKEALEDFAAVVASEGRIARSQVNGLEVTGVAYNTDPGGCKLVGAWYDIQTKAIRNYRVCAGKASPQGAVAHMPREAASIAAVQSSIKGAVMRGEARGKFEEFAIRAIRVPAHDGGVSCGTELIITSSDLLSFYGFQEACN